MTSIYNTNNLRIINSLIKGIDDNELRSDCRQAAWLAIVQAAKEYPNHPEWGGWRGTVYRVARWAVLTELSHGRRWHAVRNAPPDITKWWLESPESPPDEELAPALAGLSDRQRMIITLRFFENHTLQQVGDRFGITKEAVRQAEVKALQNLRKALARAEGLTG